MGGWVDPDCPVGVCMGGGGGNVVWKLGTGPASLSGFSFGMHSVGGLSE